jgi:hypothetical protein
MGVGDPDGRVIRTGGNYVKADSQGYSAYGSGTFLAEFGGGIKLG